MARAVNVGIVTLRGVVLNVSGIDRDTTSLLFRSLIDAGVIHEIGVALQSQNLGDSGSQSGLAVVNVTDGTDVDMLQRAVKFFLFSHWKYPPLIQTDKIACCKAIILDFSRKIKYFARICAESALIALGHDLICNTLGNLLVISRLHGIQGCYEEG